MKLFNNTIDRRLFKQYPLGSDLSKQEVVVKIFNPTGGQSWFIINSDPEDPDYLWAIVDMGYGAEVGSVSRSDLENYRGRFGLGFERDLSFDPVNASELFKGLRQGKYYAHGGGIENKDTWQNLLEKFGFKKGRSKFGLDFYSKRGYSATVDNKQRRVELMFDNDVLYSGYSVQGLLNSLQEEFGKRNFADGGKLFQPLSSEKKQQREKLKQNILQALFVDGKNPITEVALTHSGSKYSVGNVDKQDIRSVVFEINSTKKYKPIIVYLNTYGVLSLKTDNKYAHGGDIENFSDNQLMIMNQNVQLEHHHEELEDILKDKTPVPAWVVAKMATATDSVSAITHYLDGQKELMEDEEEEDEDDIMNKEVVEPINVTAGTKTELTKNFTQDAWGNLRGFLKGMEGIDLRDDYTFDYKNEQFEIEPIINTDDKGVSNAVFSIFDGDGEEVGIVTYSREGGKQKFTANSEFFSWNNAKFEDGGYFDGTIPNVSSYMSTYANGGGIGFIPMDLEEDLRITAKWGGTNIKGVIGILNAMIDSGLTDEDLHPKPTKSGSAYEKALAKKTEEIWAKIEPNYKGDFKGYMYYSTILHLVQRSTTSDNILKRFKPFRKYQKNDFARGGMVVTSIKDIPNFEERLNQGKITYRGLGLGKLWDDFYNLTGTTGTRIKVDGKEYYITDEEFNTFSRDANGKLRIRFDAPYRKYEDGGGLKKYILKADIESVTVKRGGKEVKYKGADVYNGANMLSGGGDLSSKANYIPKRDVVEVELKDGSKVKPVNGYWVKKGAEPVGAEPTPTSSGKSEPKIGMTRIRKDMRGNWLAETNIDNFDGHDWRLSTIKTFSGKVISSAQGGKTEPTGSKGVSMFSYTMYQDPHHTLEVSQPKRLTEKAVTEQHEKALAKFKKFMETGSFGRGGKISNFDKLSAKVAKQYEGKPVKSQYQEEYGKFYSKEEAKEVGDKVAGKVKALQADKKAFGGLFGSAKQLVTPSKKYPDLKGKEVMLNSGKYVQVFSQNGDKLMVLELGKFGTGETPHEINISEVDPTSYEMGGATNSKKPKSTQDGRNKSREMMRKATPLARQIRKDGESWHSALKRAFAQLKG